MPLYSGRFCPVSWMFTIEVTISVCSLRSYCTLVCKWCYIHRPLTPGETNLNQLGWNREFLEVIGMELKNNVQFKAALYRLGWFSNSKASTRSSSKARKTYRTLCFIEIRWLHCWTRLVEIALFKFDSKSALRHTLTWGMPSDLKNSQKHGESGQKTKWKWQKPILKWGYKVSIF